MIIHCKNCGNKIKNITETLPQNTVINVYCDKCKMRDGYIVKYKALRFVDSLNKKR